MFKAKDRFGAEIEFELKEPTLHEENEAEMQYRIAYSAGLKTGVLTRKAMQELLRKYEIWKDDDEKEMTEVTKGLALLEIDLHHAESRSDNIECATLAGKLAEKRNRLFELFMLTQSSYMNSCEGYADAVRIEALMAACVVVKATGKRYWKDYKEYIMERDENPTATVAIGASQANLEVLQAKRLTMIDDWPEQKWLKDIKTKTFTDENIVKSTIVERIEEAVKNDQMDLTNNDTAKRTEAAS